MALQLANRVSALTIIRVADFLLLGIILIFLSNLNDFCSPSLFSRQGKSGLGNAASSAAVAELDARTSELDTLVRAFDTTTSELDARTSELDALVVVFDAAMSELDTTTSASSSTTAALDAATTKLDSGTTASSSTTTESNNFIVESAQA